MPISFKEFLFLLLFYMRFASTWETADTCQLAYLKSDKEAGWTTYVCPIEFSTDKSGLYSFLVSISNGTYKYSNPSHTTGITDITIDIPAASNDAPQLGTIFGMPANTTNSIVVGETFFEAMENGNYTFKVQASDAAMLYIFKDVSRFCCSNRNDPNADDIFHAGIEYSYEIPSDPGHSNNTITVNMIAGRQYGMEFNYINLSGDAKFALSVITPSGETISDLTGFVGQLNVADCDNVHTTSTKYSTWSLDSTSTYASTVFTIDQTTTTTLETVYYVITPAAEAISLTESSSSEFPSTAISSSQVSMTSDELSSIISSSIENPSSIMSASSSEEVASLPGSFTSEKLSSDISTSQNTQSSVRSSSEDTLSSGGITSSVTLSSITIDTSTAKNSSEVASSSIFSSSSDIYSEVSSASTNNEAGVSRSRENDSSESSFETSVSKTLTISPSSAVGSYNPISQSTSHTLESSSASVNAIFGNSSTVSNVITSSNEAVTGAPATDNYEITDSITEPQFECTKCQTSSKAFDSVSHTHTTTTDDIEQTGTETESHPAAPRTSRVAVSVSTTVEGLIDHSGVSVDRNGQLSNVDNTKTLSQSSSDSIDRISQNSITPAVTRELSSQTTRVIASAASPTDTASLYSPGVANSGAKLHLGIFMVLITIVIF